MEVAGVGQLTAAAGRVLPQDVLERLRSQHRPECFERPAAHVDPVAAENAAQVVFAVALFILRERMGAGAVERGQVGDEFRHPGKDPHPGGARGVHDAPGAGERDVLVVERADGNEQGVQALRPQAGEERLRPIPGP